jgi:hypothetical protein
VQHRQLHEGEVIREQTGMRLVGYVYRDANGVIARNIFYLTPYSYYPSRSFGALGPEFDPINPPFELHELEKVDREFRAYNWALVGPLISPECTIDPESPWVPAHLRHPTSVSSRTFGHRYSSGELDQNGGRYRRYSADYTSQAIATSIAVDRKTGMTFYTQAPSPTAPPDSSKDANRGFVFVNGKQIPWDVKPSLPEENSRLATFYSAETKVPRPLQQQVWIVLVY